MTLFLVGVIEMIIAAFWTKAVTKANHLMTGSITLINIFIWYYVIQAVINNIGSWTAILPYAVGCAIGAMLGSVIDTKFTSLARFYKKQRRHKASRKAVSANATGPRAYESIR